MPTDSVNPAPRPALVRPRLAGPPQPREPGRFDRIFDTSIKRRAVFDATLDEIEASIANAEAASNAALILSFGHAAALAGAASGSSFANARAEVEHCARQRAGRTVEEQNTDRARCRRFDALIARADAAGRPRRLMPSTIRIDGEAPHANERALPYDSPRARDMVARREDAAARAAAASRPVETTSRQLVSPAPSSSAEVVAGLVGTMRRLASAAGDSILIDARRKAAVVDRILAALLDLDANERRPVLEAVIALLPEPKGKT